MKGGEIRILLVEDDDIDREAIYRAVHQRHLPYRLTSVSTGKMALDTLSDTRFDVVLLDYKLGITTAFDLLPHIRTLNIPVIIVTGRGTESIAVDAMRLGASDYLIKDPDGNYLTVLPVTIKSVLEKYKAKNELEELRALMKDIIDSMPSMLVGVDNQCRINHWNREAERMTGISADDALGQILESAYPPLTNYNDIVQTALSEKQIQKHELVVKKKGKENFLWNITVYPLVNCAKKGAVLRVDDVTEKMRMEAMILHSEKMLSVSGLAVGMAHELNNPLAGIVQSIQVIKQRLDGNSPKNKEVAETCGVPMTAISQYMERRGVLAMMNSITESGHRAAQIVNNLLTFSQTGNNTSAPHHLGKLMDDALLMASKDTQLQHNYRFDRISIHKEYRTSLPPVLCEPSKMKQVFFNIIKNGTQAMNGNPASRPPEFHIRVYPDGNVVCVEIEDNGKGIDKQLQRRIFEPFFTARKVGEGAGLGLSVSYFIITREHKGSIEVVSSPGNGACFILRLPLDRRKR